MGVSLVLNYPLEEGRIGQQVIDEIQIHLDSIGAENTGNFSVCCDTYQNQILGMHKSIYLVWDSDHPDSSYTFLCNNLVNSFVSDSNFDQILDKLAPLYTHKPRIEAKGTLNKVHDFTIKLASVVYGPLRSFRGILIEIQYHPCSIPKECFQIFREFTSTVFTNSLSVNFEEYTSKFATELPQTTPQVISQYLEHFTNLKLSSNSATNEDEETN